MAKEFPLSYKDPLYAQLDAQSEAELGLPTGLLASVRMNGERSNHDQTNSNKTATVYQFIPATQEAIRKKYGIDVTLNPENASKGAGLLLQESLKRNQNKPDQAVGEYIGGINRDNWGSQTKAYINRVMVGLNKNSVPKDAANSAQPRSLSSELAAASQTQAPSIAKVYEAYQAGKMSPEQEKEFEADVSAGSILLPRNAKLKISEPSNVVPNAVIEAYTNGKMNDPQIAEFRADVQSGAVKLPEGISLGELKTPGIIDRIKDVVTGELRQTDETRTLPEWTGMPEMNQLSMASMKAGAGTMFAPSAEIPKILKAQFPNMEIRADAKGNSILKSPSDGKEYIIPPGLTMGDLPRVIGGVAAFTPAGRALTLPGQMAGAAATQAAIEGTQAATGGEFNTTDVALAGAAAPVAALVAKGVGGTVQGVKNVLQKSSIGSGKPMQAAVNAVPETVAPVPVMPQAVAPQVAETTIVAPAATSTAEAIAPKTTEELADLARKAATGTFGKTKATEQLAAQASPSKTVTDAAQRLKMELDPEFVTDNEQFRKLMGLMASRAGSEAEARSINVVKNAADRAETALAELGATKDIASISDKVKGSLAATRNELEKSSDALYKEIDDAIPKSTPVQLPTLTARINKVAEDMGGVSGLSSQEKALSSMLSEPVTYGRLARERGLIGKALAGKESPYGSMEEGTLKQLYSSLAEDQLNAVNAIGGEAMRDKYRLASQTVAKRKGLEKRIVETFGRDGNGSLVSSLRNGIASSIKGDDKGLNKLLKVIPPDMQKEAMSTALLNYASSSTKGGQFGFPQFEKMYRGMRDNSPVYAAVVKSLGPNANEVLTDLYQVSRAIAKAQDAVLYTGKANQAILNNMKGAETLVGKVLEGAKSAAARGAAMEVATSLAVGPTGAGFMAGAVQAAATPRKDVAKAIGELLTSPEFKEVIQQVVKKGEAPPHAVTRLAKAKAMRGYGQYMGETFKRDITEREAWINSAIQSGRPRDKDKSKL
jgi:hypothetical protein